MEKRHVLPLVLFVAVVASLAGGDALGQSCMLADFDQDNDLWTIETVCAEASCEFTVILEAPPEPLAGQWFWIDIAAGCCEVDEVGSYGAWVELDPDLDLVDESEKLYLPCLCCVPWMLHARFRADAELIPGERYVLGRGIAQAICDEDPPCPPPHDFTLSFTLEEGSQYNANEVLMTLTCPTTGVSIDDGLTCSTEILGAPHPNPVQSAMSVAVNMPEAAKAQVRVVDVGGRVLATLVDGEIPGGRRTVSWDVDAEGEGRLANGIYFVRMDAVGMRQSRMFVVSR
jgi:hypothetical protein